MISSPNLFLRNKKYISFFRWTFFLFILVHHSQFALSVRTFAHNFYNLSNFAPLATDCFFVISGFLLAKHFFLKKNLLNYTKKRFLSLFPTCLLFWICFQFIGFLGWIEVDILTGYKDIFGLNIFGIPWHHNQMNFTWFCYALFWSNVLFFALFYLKKYFIPVALTLITISAYILFNHFFLNSFITIQPYAFPLTLSGYRAIFSCGIGAIFGIFHIYTKNTLTKDPLQEKQIYTLLTIIELSQVIFFSITCYSFAYSYIYLIGIVNFSILLTSVSFKNSLFYQITSFNFFHNGEQYLLGAYIFSSIALLCVNQLILKYSFLNDYGNTMLLFSVILSILMGYIVFKITHKIQRTFIKTKNSY